MMIEDTASQPYEITPSVSEFLRRVSPDRAVVERAADGFQLTLAHPQFVESVQLPITSVNEVPRVLDSLGLLGKVYVFPLEEIIARD